MGLAFKPENKADIYTEARSALTSLSRDVAYEYDSAIHQIPPIHRGDVYRSTAVRYALKVNRIESAYTTRVYATASKISAASGPGWEKQPEVLKLWHDLAVAVTYFSEHPTKKVATLIISGNGKLLTFGANRVPEGLPKSGNYLIEKIRQHYIVCSERIALARYLGFTVTPPRGLSKRDRRQNMRPLIKTLTDRIIAEGCHNESLKDSFLLTTTSLCELCAHAVAPYAPKGILTVEGNGKNFTRAAGIRRAADYLSRSNIPIITLPRI
jgi:hypothetical protein